MSKKFHHAFGVYGVMTDGKNLVVIKKNGGPYLNRFDLPGGSLDDGEPLAHAIKREIQEETQIEVIQVKQLGTTSFRFPWQYKNWQYNQHICVFYNIEKFSGPIADKVAQFTGQDSLGAVWIELSKTSIENSSPLVLKAKEYVESGLVFDVEDQYFETWDVLEEPAF
ncbi:NUDIX hydrolase [Lactiplantibacillus sp. WILCCON 0030]|uniref:NUDIX hydrolase n=1 Tax=Lactiplantibacillus brownii TaxID=3069269 RepID=A0ABU1A5K3_9LACO|nr:NUDIX hydrolase [Lactiplantibacillus brownii]MDQ7936259.1 NUDIX hydrolase [Lactiplantibacillus brownii]